MNGQLTIIELSAQLTPAVDAAVFVVLHHSRQTFSETIIQRIQPATSFSCKVAQHNDTIQSRHLYMAVTDNHLVIEKGKIILGEGPTENGWRPSIHVLFRSAAAAYNSRVIGIVLTGLMQDGTAGMLAIKRCGRTTIVQDPDEAEYPDMPRSVVSAIGVDYAIPLHQMGTILIEKIANGTPGPVAVPDNVKAEAQIAARMATNVAGVRQIGTRSEFICPDCGGLWDMISDDAVRYRCHTGHVFMEGELLLRQSEALENTLWVALRMLEERKVLLQKMVNEEKNKGWIHSAGSKHQRFAELEVHVNKLKEILFTAKSDV